MQPFDLIVTEIGMLMDKITKRRHTPSLPSRALLALIAYHRGVHVTFTQSYPATVDAVWAMLRDPQYVVWRTQHSIGSSKLNSAEVVDASDGGFTVLVNRTISTDQVSAQARSFLGSEVELRQAEVWAAPVGGQRTGTIAQDIVGVPMNIAGTMRLEASDQGCEITYEGRIMVSVPIFGATIASAAEQRIRTALQAEEEAGRLWLAGQR